ncbi:phosphoribosylanthranilate isomerase [Halovenus marina]|uniref:phosphoribosylanthranilate isomerase n=1 Tax=Halovenus marina TaxID=3396621 RepID=UPI003F54C0B0
MSYTRVKICGLTREQDVETAVAVGADAVGFIVDVPVDTPRELPAKRARALVDSVPPFVTTILVTMPDSVQTAVSLYERVGADAIQVHGGLSAEHLGGLRERIDGHLVATVDTETPDIDEYAAAADALLVDSTDETGGGGTGETHDWKQSAAHVDRLNVPVVLAGGLTPDNVARAVETVDPFGVDTASGVESSGGQKDPDAVAAFVENARRGSA